MACLLLRTLCIVFFAQFQVRFDVKFSVSYSCINMFFQGAWNDTFNFLEVRHINCAGCPLKHKMYMQSNETKNAPTCSHEQRQRIHTKS